MPHCVSLLVLQTAFSEQIMLRNLTLGVAEQDGQKLVEWSNVRIEDSPDGLTFTLALVVGKRTRAVVFEESFDFYSERGGGNRLALALQAGELISRFHRVHAKALSPEG
jgi:hypothetical protein